MIYIIKASFLFCTKILKEKQDGSLGGLFFFHPTATALGGEKMTVKCYILELDGLWWLKKTPNHLLFINHVCSVFDAAFSFSSCFRRYACFSFSRRAIACSCLRNLSSDTSSLAWFASSCTSLQEIITKIMVWWAWRQSVMGNKNKFR